MFTTKLLTRTIVTIVTVFVLALSGVSPALAAAPSNDNFGGATIIGALSFNDSVDITEATTEANEPQACNSSSQSVWYTFTPTANTVVRADLAESNFGDTAISIYQDTGSGLGGLNLLDCRNFGGTITINLQSGVTYYIQAGKYFGGAGTLSLNLQEIPPPANDNFAIPTVIDSSLPFEDAIDTAGATVEAGEPMPTCGSSSKTAWYSFTPTTSGSISAYFTQLQFNPMLAAYTGTSLTDLTEVGCRPFGSMLTFRANAGTTYYFQVGGIFGEGGNLRFRLAVTPAPTAGICFGPSQPSVFDNMQFNDCSSDPGEAGFQSFTWDFGDGTSLTTTDCCVNHRYAADGDYTVQHTVTTVDGRSASTSVPVQVRTHDVAITKVSAPQSANQGQTRSIIVYLNNKRYGENVQIDLYKSVPGGFEFVGSYTQFVPVRTANRTTAFTFNYTFTSSDASVGKVTFRATASIVGSNDALPADNQLASSPPTKVGR